MKISYKFIFGMTFFFIAIFTGNSFSQNHWSVISSPTSRTLTNCFFINSNTGWISGDSGTIIHTTNGGANWTIQNSHTFNNIEDIYFLNEKSGWAVSYEVFPDSLEFAGTQILKTTDSGNNWTISMFPDTNMFMKSVYFTDSLRGFLGGIASSIALTTNGGITWNYTDTDTSLLFILPVFKIKFYDFNLGYACGGFRDIAGVAWVTTNGGLNWKGKVLAPEPFFDLTILDQYKTICAGGDLEYGSAVAKTSDQGMNWFYDTLGVFGLATGIDNRTLSEIWMASSYAGKFIYSLDTGNSWTVIETPGNSAIFDLDFTDSNHAFACGNNGKILKFDNSFTVVKNNQFEISGSGFMLSQNYPNPFNPITSLVFGIKELGFVSLKVYDVLGNEVATLVNEKKNPGSYIVEFDGSNLSSGVYYYKLKAVSQSGAGEFEQVKKMILLK